MKCETCREELAKEDLFCPECGTKIIDRKTKKILQEIERTEKKLSDVILKRLDKKNNKISNTNKQLQKNTKIELDKKDRLYIPIIIILVFFILVVYGIVTGLNCLW